MFKLSLSKTYLWPVTAMIPADGGSFDKANFDAEFKRLPASKVKELLSGSVKTDKDFVNEVLIGWKGIANEDGSVVAFSESNKERLLEVAGMSKAIVAAFFESQAGEKTKN